MKQLNAPRQTKRCKEKKIQNITCEWENMKSLKITMKHNKELCKWNGKTQYFQSPNYSAMCCWKHVNWNVNISGRSAADLENGFLVLPVLGDERPRFFSRERGMPQTTAEIYTLHAFMSELVKAKPDMHDARLVTLLFLNRYISV